MKDEDNNRVEEPLVPYSQPLNFEKVWLMFQETDKQFKETDKKFQETDKQFQETKKLLDEKFQETDKQFKESKKLLDEKFQETDKQFKETDKKFQETDRKINRLSEITSGLGINLGEVAEDFFREALENMDEIFEITYNEVCSLEKHTKKLQGQYDIVLFNEDTIVVIEVKQKLHPKDVEDFHKRKLPNFKKLFPEYKERKLIGAVAGLTVPHAAKELAASLGYLVFTQGAHKIKVLNKKGFVPVRL